MKKILCHLFIVWLTLLSVCASAHATTEALHKALSTHEQSDQDSHQFAAAADANIQAMPAADAGHSDSCNPNHCGHGHTAGVATGQRASFKTAAEATLPKSPENWVSSPVISNIERPKWPVTTPAVVNLLG